MTKIRNYRTPEGAALGKIMAKWCDDAEPHARLRLPELPPRCNSCALRAGIHLANGSPATQLDVIKCVIEGREFYCHEPAREGHLCSGWAMFMLAKKDAEFGSVPWNFVGGIDGGRSEPADGARGADRDAQRRAAGARRDR